MAAGKKLFLEQNPHCNIPEVPNNFLFVKEIMAKTEEWCERIKVDMEVYGVAENGGTGLFAALLPFGHDKRGHQLKDKVEVGLQLAITLAPPSVGQTLETTKAIARGVYDLCNDGIERILTKGSGCTQEIKYYRPSKAKHYTDDAARSGQVALFWGDTDTTIGKLVLDVFN
ncbi:hypothetical protein BKA66DRAFT_454467 [Pyrenochaeta sp. MPI-SDFR-AT-0127]|nr:hypothetical protein BKA66DRAFT_454467 [Pyrenochaeta sp. MPI-SDFR-AT-0127]